jgi:Zn-dependent peptidase ImmA (M78 family)
MVRVPVQPELLRWALERSGRSEESARTKFPKFPKWLDGTRPATVRQLETFANWTRTPLGFLMLDSPPEDRLSIPDFRTTGGRTLRPSPDLLETVQAMQRRQEWMQEFLIEEGHEPLGFVGEANIQDSPKDVAQSMRNALGLSDQWARKETSWTAALRLLRQAIEAADIMVVINGVVGNNTHRRLDVNEFRGFALTARVAPLIFVNGQDAKCAQMFTLAHELAHLWIGAEGVSNFDRLQPVGADVEIFCNRVAAEFLVPIQEFETEWQVVATDLDRFDRLARTFKVSALVAARRALDLRYITREEFFTFYDHQIQTSLNRRKKSSGGDFWKTQGVRIGDMFGSAVAHAVWAGKLLYRDAYKLTGLRGKTFDNYIAGLGL